LLRRLTYAEQDRVAHTLNNAQLAGLLSCMSSDDRVDLFKRLSTERGEALLQLMAQAEREDIRKLGAYAEGTTGSIMSSNMLDAEYAVC
jgi:magnesium transporter